MIMRSITATEASRRFSDLLDAIEAGKTIAITRGNRPIAEIGPVYRRTGADFGAALIGSTPPDDTFEENLAEAVSSLLADGGNPWAVA